MTHPFCSSCPSGKMSDTTEDTLLVSVSSFSVVLTSLLEGVSTSGRVKLVTSVVRMSEGKECCLAKSFAFFFCCNCNALADERCRRALRDGEFLRLRPPPLPLECGGNGGNLGLAPFSVGDVGGD